MDIISLFHAMGGIVAFSTLIANGFTRTQINRAVATGQIFRVRRGVYAHPSAPSEALTAARHGGMLTCVSVLRARGVWVLPEPGPPHVWLGGNGREFHHPDCTCVTHWSPGRARIGSVGLETALLHLRKCSGDLAFFASFESAWAKRLLSTSARSRIRDRLPVSKRWLVDKATGNAGSGLESVLRFLLMQVGLSLETQVNINTVGRVDFIIRLRGKLLILEVDGREFHTSRGAFNEDRRRQAAASNLGIETLNFSYDQILHQWPEVLASIRAAMTRTADAA
ncbi:type IV toxin-antitoxin system AbiEi family antitoxin domain-containing protein [Galactobacter sp.]|uniref:type IV toxin-antitoxin system AbiEi family antitoxin domain-containing protein n=1 Tax=Galactobacter sp. TaxID=2676125 RepID=UPI0025C6B797|nr:type IV toxin-antitoxin system AbiEi family antitoxin domain-containing protein [Galactobacter sp.]